MIKFNKRGMVDPVSLVIIVALGAFILFTKGNPFDNSADPSNRRTASAVSGNDLVKITNAVANSEKPVTVEIDRSVRASAEVTDPKLTWGQRIGRFFSGLGTWALVFLFGGLVVLIVVPGAWGWFRSRDWKGVASNLVGGIKDLEDPETYAKVTTSISKRQKASKRATKDAKLVDKLKMDMHS